MIPYDEFSRALAEHKAGQQLLDESPASEAAEPDAISPEAAPAVAAAAPASVDELPSTFPAQPAESTHEIDADQVVEE